eukprot:CAMPEP_0196767856 /NCGR_PEP_ID=MMETSP1095-20130614/42045_1 /TAXON_ID=96789 ORGANISM="Chromulina nebulosa, Strain UTEXLB2642" /NCGR_SAMPLE_ID=MMETSP1095 /ASSEMBLY_ACC=CAM_ASM_000446 /LENGTH=208 /DNA_ID=CAMNT_0042136607 /DNA_START=528 /DNA_END=1151 /DNA_ORIENTATION=+
MTEAVTHLEIELVKFGVPLRDGVFKLCDVHKSKSILNYDHPRFQLSGGTDFVIIPSQTPSDIGTAYEICVAFEIKTDEVIDKEGIDKYYNQAIGELIASRCLSSQPVVLVVLTDISRKATIFQYSFDNNRSSSFIEIFKNVSLEQMASKVRQHLEDFCVPDALYEPPEEVEEASAVEIGVVQFKKKQKLNQVSSLDQLEDMMMNRDEW